MRAGDAFLFSVPRAFCAGVCSGIFTGRLRCFGGFAPGRARVGAAIKGSETRLIAKPGFRYGAVSAFGILEVIQRLMCRLERVSARRSVDRWNAAHRKARFLLWRSVRARHTQGYSAAHVSARARVGAAISGSLERGSSQSPLMFTARCPWSAPLSARPRLSAG